MVLRISAQGARTWSVYKWSRALRKPVRFSLGPYPSIGIDLARRKALEIIAGLDQGRDPQQERRERHAVPTLGELSAAYVKRLQANGRRHPLYLDDMLRLSFKDWLPRRLDTISQREISERHDRIAAARGPVAAARAVKALRTLFAHAEGQLGLTIRNAARPVRVKDSNPRGRHLTAAEERKLMTVLTAESQNVQDYIRLLLLTGARRDNVAGMRWCDVSWDERTWTIKGAQAKAGHEISVPLLPEALAVLQRRRAELDDQAAYCFPSRGKTGRLVEVWFMFRRVKARALLLDLGLDWTCDDPVVAVAALDPAVCEGKGLGSVTVHDLRRTVAVKLVSSGASLPVIAAALGHRSLKTTQQVYALATAGDVRAAMEKMTVANANR